MEEALNIDKYCLIDDDELFLSGIDGLNEIEGAEDYREAITFDTLDQAKRFKKILGQNWGEDFNIVKVHFEFIE